jgi:hypothetical protein
MSKVINFRKGETNFPNNYVEDIEKYVGYCDFCKEDFYENEEVYLVEDGEIHTDCFLEYAKKRLEPVIIQVK